MTTYQLLPDLTPDERTELSEDIRHNGIRVPIDVDEEGQVLDGHHRIAIAAELGLECPRRTVYGLTDEQKRAHALAVNLHRRHLSRDQKRELIRRSLRADPHLSDRQHAERTSSSAPTVGTVRSEMEDAGELSKFNSRQGADGRTRTVPDDPPDDPLPPEVAEQINERIAQKTMPRREPVMLTLRTNKGEEVPYPKPQGKATFNESTGEGISWAAWSWNPVTGCLHGCDYCYARAIAHRWTDAYPAGFTPVFHHDPDRGYTRLDAPTNTVIPERHRDDNHPSCGRGDCDVCAYRRVFVCSMADLYGRWVPDEWIGSVHASMLAAPDWQYILLTKFPARYAGLEIPPKAWVGTSVDEQKRVRIAQDSMAKLDGGMVKWLSLEPLKEPLEFDDLSMFDWVVIGAQTETYQPDGTVPAFAPHYDWVQRITEQARAAGCRVHHKPNLTNGKPGMKMLNEYPSDQ